MRNKIAWILLCLATAAMLIACGEKPCNVQGSTKAEKGILYYCDDRGEGKRWYKSGGSK